MKISKESQYAGALRQISLKGQQIDKIDIIDPRIASQVLELDLANNNLKSLTNIEQFKSLSKLNLSNNKLVQARELYILKGLEHLESLSIQGNPFQEDEKYIQKFVYTTLKSVSLLNGQYLQSSEYNLLSSPSQATTGGVGGQSSASLQNIPEILRELSTFSQTLKNVNGITNQQPAKTSQSNLVNAKIGKGNNKSRLDTNEGPLSSMRIEENIGQKTNGYDDQELDSFDKLNFSNDGGLINFNLQQSRDLQKRLTSTLNGLSSHCQFLTSSSQERKTNYNNFLDNGKLVATAPMDQLRRITIDNQRKPIQFNSAQETPQALVMRQISDQPFLNRIVSYHQPNPSSSESERSSVKSITTLNSSSRYSNNHQIPKDSVASRNMMSAVSGSVTERNHVPFELKKSQSQLGVKIKRQSINFINKEISSRNSTVRGSFLMRENSQSSLGNGPIFATIQNGNRDSNDNIFISTNEKQDKNDKLLNNFVELFRKQTQKRQNNELKAKALRAWTRLFRYKHIMRVNGMQIYQRLTRLDQSLKKRTFEIKIFTFEKWRNVMAVQRFQEQVIPKMIQGIRKLMLRVGMETLKLRTGLKTKAMTQCASVSSLNRQVQHSKAINYGYITNDMNSIAGAYNAGCATARARTNYDSLNPTEAVLKDLINENVQKQLGQGIKLATYVPGRTRNSGFSNQGSISNFGNSIERKSNANNSLNNQSTAKKKKVIKTTSNSRNQTGMKHSQSSMTLVNGSQFASANGNSDKKTKITSQVLKKGNSPISMVQQTNPSQQSLYKMFTTTSRQQNLASDRPQSANHFRSNPTSQNSNKKQTAKALLTSQNEIKSSFNKSRLSTGGNTNQTQLIQQQLTVMQNNFMSEPNQNSNKKPTQLQMHKIIKATGKQINQSCLQGRNSQDRSNDRGAPKSIQKVTLLRPNSQNGINKEVCEYQKGLDVTSTKNQIMLGSEIMNGLNSAREPRPQQKLKLSKTQSKISLIKQ